MRSKLFLVLFFSAVILTGCNTTKKGHTLTEKEQYAERVKTAFMKGWTAYKDYAWGMDAVNPISQKGHNWYSHTLLMTPVDAYSTMCLMNLDSA